MPEKNLNIKNINSIKTAKKTNDPIAIKQGERLNEFINEKGYKQEYFAKYILHASVNKISNLRNCNECNYKLNDADAEILAKESGNLKEYYLGTIDYKNEAHLREQLELKEMIEFANRENLIRLCGLEPMYPHLFLHCSPIRLKNIFDELESFMTQSGKEYSQTILSSHSSRQECYIELKTNPIEAGNETTLEEIVSKKDLIILYEVKRNGKASGFISEKQMDAFCDHLNP